MMASPSGRGDTGRRCITVVAVGDDGTVERRFTINPDGNYAAKLNTLRGRTVDAYVESYEERPRTVNLSDWPLIGGERSVHGVEGATFVFPVETTGKERAT